MNKQTIFIIVIIVFFNFLLLNIFRLQNDLFSLKSYKNNNKDNKNNNLSGFNKNKNKYKPLNNNNNDSVRGKLNNIASLVDIDMNKIDKTDAQFIPKYKQI
jgi:hypothetical protein|tara:strand:+ start:997 stop:1299 length:303 start_codon:yes stop_codon:yes gene_type:complete